MDDNRFQMTCGNIELGILSKLGPCPGNPGHTFRPSCFWSSPVELFGPFALQTVRAIFIFFWGNLVPSVFNQFWSNVPGPEKQFVTVQMESPSKPC